MQDNISILIVDDEPVWMQILQITLRDLGFTVVNGVANVDDALLALGKCDYDIALLDIQMNGKNSGIELGKIINKVYNKPFIFVTASNEHTIKEAAAANPSAYLRKPINSSTLFIAIQNAINNFNIKRIPSDVSEEDDNFSSFFLKQGAAYKKINWVDVAYITAGKNYVNVYNTADKTEYYIRSSLQKTQQHIIPRHLQKQFVQLNRSEIINVAFINEVTADKVTTEYGTFSISEGYTKELKSRLNIVT
jgi:DNA-binding LytR/AlgR family response regulator